jgi:fructose-1-phosphate kinase PfkB-like protein
VETEIIEPFSLDIDGEELTRSLLGIIDSRCGKPDAVVYSGQAPDGCPGDIYEKIQDHVQPGFSLLDSYKNVGTGFFQSVEAVKINRNELEYLKSRLNGFFPVVEKGACAWVMVTDGGNMAHIYQKQKETKGKAGRKWLRSDYTLPVLDKIKNPVGAGDVVTAGVAHNILLGNSYQDAFACALAMGSASCLTVMPCEYRQKDFDKILGQINFNTEF